MVLAAFPECVSNNATTPAVATAELPSQSIHTEARAPLHLHPIPGRSFVLMPRLLMRHILPFFRIRMRTGHARLTFDPGRPPTQGPFQGMRRPRAARV